jgi:hypothetical protein
MKFQQDIRAEYHALTAEEKADYVTAHEDRKADLIKARRPSAKARVTDMVKTLDNVEAMVSVLFIEFILIVDLLYESLKLSRFALASRASFTLSDPMLSFIVVPVSGTHIPSSRRMSPSLHRGVEAGTPPHLVRRSKHSQLLAVMLGVRFLYLNLQLSLQLISSFSHEQDLEEKAQWSQDNNYYYSTRVSWYVNVFWRYSLVLTISRSDSFSFWLVCLAAAAKKTNAVMSYIHYKRDVVLRYGVILEGWPEDIEFACPSKLGNNLSILTRLRDAVVAGSCSFRPLTAAEQRHAQEEYDSQVAGGEVIQPVRKTRKDAGQKRSRAEIQSDEEEEVDVEADNQGPEPAEPISARAGKWQVSKKARYTQPITEEDCAELFDNDNDNDDGAENSSYAPPSPATSEQPNPSADQSESATLPSQPLDGSRFAYLRGEVARGPHGRRLFSATPPAELTVGKRIRAPPKVSHLGFEASGSGRGNKENRHPVSTNRAAAAELA